MSCSKTKVGVIGCGNISGAYLGASKTFPILNIVACADLVAGVMDFASGAVGTILTSFDVWAADLPRIEIYGTEGSLSCPDPNGFGGPVLLRRAGSSAWNEVPLIRPDAHRGIGVADMAAAMEHGRPHRASGELAYHVLDVMQSFHDASREGRYIEIASTCSQPAPLPVGLFADQLG